MSTDDEQAPGIEPVLDPADAHRAQYKATAASLVARYSLEPEPVDLVRAAAQAKAEAGWVDARGDDDTLPAEVRGIVERHAADQADRTTADYLVTYRHNPMPDGADAYDVMVTPALFTLGENGTTGIQVDHAQSLNEYLQRVTSRFASAADGFGEAMREVGEAAAPAIEAMRNLYRPVHDLMTGAFARVVYITDGLPPGPIVDGPSAAAAVWYARGTVVLRRPPKQSRRNAKRAYLAVKRHLPREDRHLMREHREGYDRPRRIPVNQFGAL